MFFRKERNDKESKTIKFFPSKEVFDVIDCAPVQASKLIPDWYKKIPTYINENIKEPLHPEGGVNLTVKPCIPFLDALTTGYMIVTSADILVSHSQPHRLNWEVSWTVVSIHGNNQVNPMPIQHEYEKDPFKFECVYGIQTPPGYSLLFTHPLNRYDLPFITFSGIVDTDTYGYAPVNLPFILRKDFEGIIKKGTPIAQVIPIKREDWKSVTYKYDETNLKVKYAQDRIKSSMFRSYKDRFWQRKKYS